MALSPRQALYFKSERGVFEDREPGEDAALLPDEEGPARTVNRDEARVRLDEPRQRPEKGRLAGSTRPDDAEKLPFPDRERKVRECLGPSSLAYK
jgi:hypothetical protein